MDGRTLGDKDIIAMTKQRDNGTSIQFSIILPESNREVTSEWIPKDKLKGVIIAWCDQIRGQITADEQAALEPARKRGEELRKQREEMEKQQEGELQKAHEDLALHGTGVIQQDEKGIKHVPCAELKGTGQAIATGDSLEGAIARLKAAKAEYEAAKGTLTRILEE